MQFCGSLNILWHCLSLGLEWKLRNEITKRVSVDGTVLNVSWAKKVAWFCLATFSYRHTSASGQSWFDQQVSLPCTKYSKARESGRKENVITVQGQGDSGRINGPRETQTTSCILLPNNHWPIFCSTCWSPWRVCHMRLSVFRTLRILTILSFHVRLSR